MDAHASSLDAHPHEKNTIQARPGRIQARVLSHPRSSMPQSADKDNPLFSICAYSKDIFILAVRESKAIFTIHSSSKEIYFLCMHTTRSFALLCMQRRNLYSLYGARPCEWPAKPCRWASGRPDPVNETSWPQVGSKFKGSVNNSTRCVACFSNCLWMLWAA